MGHDPRTDPAARSADLVISDAGEDLLIYDRRSNHLHHLNAAAVRVWRACDGQRTLAEVWLAAGLDPVDGEDIIGRLRAADLLDGDAVQSASESRTTRRRVLQSAAIAVPVIVSVSAPTAVLANSPMCGSGEQFCELDGKCFNPNADGCCTTADCIGSFCYGGSCRDGYDPCDTTADCIPGLICQGGLCFDPLRPNP